VQQEVVLAGEEEDVQHLRLPGHARDELAEVAAGAGLQPDRDHRLQRQAEGRGVDLGVVAADDSALPQRPHAGQAR
jgi:hypothetical protein